LARSASPTSRLGEPLTALTVLRRFAPSRLDLRARVVLFTSLLVVASLLLLGTALHALLAKSLYTQ
jgi:hypothetical protein